MAKSTSFLVVLTASLALAATAANGHGAPSALKGGAPENAITPPGPGDIALAPGERLISILATNDIHGAIEAKPQKDGTQVGGMAYWAGAIDSIRKGLDAKYGNRAGVLVVDGGDQFQGTLLSNYSEGQLMFATMNEAGYDAAITGNHDFDFGPVGWLEDKVTKDTADQNPRGALQRLVSQAKFDVLSGNSYLRDSLVDAAGKPLDTQYIGCVPKDSKAAVDWTRAQRADFAKPYVIKEVAGTRVALIGLDGKDTPSTTGIDNISDLCFRDEAATYLELRKELEGKADLFVLIVHAGNINQELNASEIAKKILAGGGGNVLHAVIAAHTHWIHNVMVGGVPVIQSGANLNAFGRVDFVFNNQSRTLTAPKMRSFAGISLSHQRCDKNGKDFCSVVQTPAGAAVAYEGVPVTTKTAVEAQVADAKKAIEPMAGRKLGTAAGTVKTDRINESPLADALTDAFRSASGAEIAFMNTGGLRTDLPAGDITYSQLFDVLPFNNRGVIMTPMKSDRLLNLLARSAQTCGTYGALMQSGLKVRFERDCTNNSTVDEKARLLHVETVSGEVILDVEKGITPAPGRTFTVATLDFLSTGGSGFDGFIGTPVVKDIGIVRELFADELIQHPATFGTKTDGRWYYVPRVAPSSTVD